MFFINLEVYGSFDTTDETNFSTYHSARLLTYVINANFNSYQKNLDIMIDKLNQHVKSSENTGGLLFELVRNRVREVTSVMCRLRDVLKIKIQKSSQTS